MKKNWRTTVFGLISALALVIWENPTLVDNDLLRSIAGLVSAGALAGLGIAGRDHKED